MSDASFVRDVVNAARHERLTYDSFIKLTKLARAKLDLKRPRRGTKLPHIVSLEALKRFYAAIDASGDLQHQIMLRLLFYTAIRVSELVDIKVVDLDLAQCKIFIEQGKGAKDRYILFPEAFRLTLQSHLRACLDNTYLFESRRKTKYSTRQIQRIVRDYADEVELPQMHPHLLRHQLLTHLTKEGVSDSQIQLISGHASKKTLEIYQHLALGDVSEDYQRAMRKVEIG